MRNSIAKGIKLKVFQAYYETDIAQGDRSNGNRKAIKDALNDTTFKAMYRRAKKSYVRSGLVLRDSTQIKLSVKNSVITRRYPRKKVEQNNINNEEIKIPMES